jgi:hypothetical protein
MATQDVKESKMEETIKNNAYTPEKQGLKFVGWRWIKRASKTKPSNR